MSRLPTTIELAFYALLFATVIGVTLGLAAALRRNSKTDVGSMMFANLGVSIPVFVLGLMLQYVFAVALRGHASSSCHHRDVSRRACRFDTIPEAWGLEWVEGFPRAILDFLSNIYTFNFLVTLQTHQLIDAAQHLILPAIALGTISLAIIARITRSSLLEVLGLDFIRTARAKGVSERRIVRGPCHAQRHASGDDGHRPPDGTALRGRHPHRDHLQPDRGGPDALRRHRGAGLRRGAGIHACSSPSAMSS